MADQHIEGLGPERPIELVPWETPPRRHLTITFWVDADDFIRVGNRIVGGIDWCAEYLAWRRRELLNPKRMRGSHQLLAGED